MKSTPKHIDITLFEYHRSLGNAAYAQITKLKSSQLKAKNSPINKARSKALATEKRLAKAIEAAEDAHLALKKMCEECITTVAAEKREMWKQQQQEEDDGDDVEKNKNNNNNIAHTVDSGSDSCSDSCSNGGDSDGSDSDGDSNAAAVEGGDDEDDRSGFHADGH
jgi:hypothetical protein